MGINDGGSNDPLVSVTTPLLLWGGEYAEESKIAAQLVSDSVRLCRKYQNEQQRQRLWLWLSREEITVNNAAGDRTPIATTASTTSKTLERTDGAPVTALDFAIQGYILSSLQLQERKNERDKDDTCRVSFMGEEDAVDLRSGDDGGMLLRLSLDLARCLNPNLTQEGFLDALDATFSTDHPKIGDHYPEEPFTTNDVQNQTRKGKEKKPLLDAGSHRRNQRSH